MAKSKKANEPVETQPNVQSYLEDIETALLALENKLNHTIRLANMTTYICDKQYEHDLMHYDAYTWIVGNMKLINDQQLFDEVADISNAVQSIRTALEA